MERILLLCCRSCLKGDGDNNEYYEILGLPDRHANQEAIKKAFKKSSLNYHPDKLAQRGIEVTAENRQMFLKLKEAYDVLSDAKRRRLYDDLGASGLKLVESPSQVNPVEMIKNFQKNRSDGLSIVLVVALVFASLLILPILFSLKCDGTLGRSAPWVAIWTPMWLVDFVALILAALLFVDQQEKVNEDGEPIQHETTPLLTKLLNMTTTILFVLIQVFLFLKLDRYIDWNWFAVFAPWLGYELVQVLMIVPVAFSPIPVPNFDELCFSADDEESGESDILMKKIILENEYFEKLFTRATERKSLVGHLLRGWLAVFLALQLNGSVNWNWGLVFLPVWVSLISQYWFSYHFRTWGHSVLESVDLRDVDAGSEIERAAKVQQGQQLLSASFIAILLTLAPAFMAILLVSRLQAASFTTFVIILPIFIILCCCCCAVFCAITCLASVDPDEISKSFERNGGEGGPTGENPMGEGMGPYEPPQPVNQSVNGEAGVDDVTVTVDGGVSPSGPVAYGTFSENNSQKNSNKPMPDLLSSHEDTKDNKTVPPAVHLLPVTTIDADID